MEPPEENRARRWTGSSEQPSFDGDEPRDRRPGPDADGSTDDDPDSMRVRFDERDDWLEASRRERRRERERSWKQLQLAT